MKVVCQWAYSGGVGDCAIEELWSDCRAGKAAFCLISKGKGKAIPLQAWTGPRVPGVRGSQISRHSAHEGGKVFSPTHRPPLPREIIPGTHFC